MRWQQPPRPHGFDCTPSPTGLIADQDQAAAIRTQQQAICLPTTLPPQAQINTWLGYRCWHQTRSYGSDIHAGAQATHTAIKTMEKHIVFQMNMGHQFSLQLANACIQCLPTSTSRFWQL